MQSLTGFGRVVVFFALVFAMVQGFVLGDFFSRPPQSACRVLNYGAEPSAAQLLRGR